jgi:hypothetical protein
LLDDQAQIDREFTRAKVSTWHEADLSRISAFARCADFHKPALKGRD